MTSPRTPTANVYIIEPGDRVELWPHGTEPTETKRHPFGTATTPWRGHVLAITGGAVALDLEGDVGRTPTIVPWTQIKWMRRKRPRASPYDIPPAS